RIGAAVTHARIEDGELPDCTRGLLPKVAAGIAYRAVRNRGTIGGRPGAAAGAFFLAPFTTALAPDEVIVAVEVPRFSDRARWAYRKTSRKPGEFSEANGAAWMHPEHCIAG